MTTDVQEALNAFKIDPKQASVEVFGSGLINRTWLIKAHQQLYILQQVNTAVFTKPAHIHDNIESLRNHLSQHHPEYLFVAPLPATNNQTLITTANNQYFRLFPFISNSHSITSVTDAKQAFEAAQAFGKFTAILQNFDTRQLQTTLPDFHNLPLRYSNFLEALNTASPERMEESKSLIAFLQGQKNIVDTSIALTKHMDFKQRVTHHDTKISNVLFNEYDEAIAVIDLDTVMPGYFLSDVGDMMRTYLSAANEEETDLSKVFVRLDFFKAIVGGYLSYMKPVLTSFEKQHFVFAGKYMIYMQALRFLTDYLNNDVYYGAAYPQHNLNRAANQVKLLQSLLDAEPALEKEIEILLT